MNPSKEEHEPFGWDNVVSITPFDSSSEEETYLIELTNGRRFVVTKLLRDIIVLLKNGNTLDEVAHKIAQTYSIETEAEDIEKILNETLTSKIGFKQDKTATEQEGIEKGSEKAFGMTLTKTLMPDRFASPLGEKLAGLFSPSVIAISLLAGISLHFFFYGFYGFGFANLLSLNFTEYIFVLVLFAMSGLFHEIGHISALKKYRKDAIVSIGGAVYLVFLVFYADVREAWYLRRRQRLSVDVGGVYFQFVFCSILIALFVVSSIRIFASAALIINLNFLWFMHPFMKFDGYWVVSDALGIPNLHGKTKDYILRVFSRKKNPASLKIRGRENFFFRIYAIGTIFFLALSGFYLVTYFPNSFVIYLNYFRYAVIYIAQSMAALSILGAIESIIRLFFFSLPYVLLIYLVVGTVTNIFLTRTRKK